MSEQINGAGISTVFTQMETVARAAHNWVHIALHNDSDWTNLPFCYDLYLDMAKNGFVPTIVSGYCLILGI
jgi:hypothetical protein